MTFLAERRAVARAARSTVGGARLIVPRRSLADRGLLLGHLVLITVLCFLTLMGPRLLVNGADAGLRGAASDAGPSADLVARLPDPLAGADRYRASGAANRLKASATRMAEALPAGLRALADAPRAEFTGQSPVAIDGRETIVTYAWWSSLDQTPVRWVRGGPPAASPEPSDELDPDMDLEAFAANGFEAEPPPGRIEVAVSRANADLLGLAVGQEITVVRNMTQETTLVVAGVYEAEDPADPAWGTVDGLLEARTTRGAAGTKVLGVMLSDESLPDAALYLLPVAQTLEVRFPLVVDRLRSTDSAEIETSLRRTITNTAELQTRWGVPTVNSALTEILPGFRVQLQGAQAQAFVMFFGVVLVGALALILTARLVLERRRAVLSAERARGASVASIALRLGLESAPLALAGLVLGALATLPFALGAAWTWTPALIVAATAALATPLGGAWIAARAWGGRHVPANRSDRERLAARRRARRVVVEAALIVLAGGAVAAVRGRGLLQTQSAGPDLLLSATPGLMAGAATVVALRVLPPVLRLAGRLAARGRGLVAVVASARAARATGGGLPLLALAVSIAMMVFAGSIATTIDHGQVRASAQQVGAEVRVDGAIPAGVASQLLAEPGVSAAATGVRTFERSLNRGSGVKVTLLVADAAQLDTILRAHDDRYQGEFELIAAGGSGAPKALVSPGLVDVVESAGASVLHGKRFVQLDVVGATGLAEPGEHLVVVDLAQIEAASGEPAEPDTLWVDGPGARAAVTAVGLDANPRVTVTAREEWLAETRDAPLGSRLVDLLLASAVVLAAFASLTMALTVVASAPERGRTLSALRTLGLDGRLARRITLGELLPVSFAAVLIGVGLGLTVPPVLHGALGVSEVTGELRAGPVSVDPVSIVLAVGATAVALAVSIAVEAAVRRRDRLGDVLRVGER